MIIKRRLKNGFTLLEIMVATVILATLAGLSVPQYFLAIEQSRSNEAKGNLNIIYMGQKVYMLNNGVYWNGGATVSVATVNTTLNIDLNPVYYTENGSGASGVYVVTSGNTYTAKLERVGSSDKTFTVDQTGALTEAGSY